MLDACHLEGGDQDLEVRRHQRDLGGGQFVGPCTREVVVTKQDADSVGHWKFVESEVCGHVKLAVVPERVGGRNYCA